MARYDATMSTSPPGSPGPQFEPPASSVPAQPQDPGQSVGPQFSAPGAGPQYPAPGFAPHDPAAAAPYPAGTMAPGAPPAGSQGFPGAEPGGPVEPPARAERVGLGLAFAACIVLGCVALTAVIYHLGFIASITAWLMAIGAAMAYRTAGGEPVKGRVPLLVLIVVGIVLGFLAMVASAVWDYYWAEMGSAGTDGEAVQLVLGNLFNVELWQDLGMDAVFYFLFAALGAFGVIRRMSGPKRAKA